MSKCAEQLTRKALLIVLLITIIWQISGSQARSQEYHPGQAKNASTQNRVLSAIEDKAGRVLVVSTSLRQPISPPFIQYLPGPDEQTIMVCDFSGLVWDQPTKVINPNVEGVLQVRLGQFEESPPIFRVAISASSADAFKKFAFRSTAGSLVIKWSGDTLGNSQKQVSTDRSQNSNLQKPEARPDNYQMQNVQASVAMTTHPPMRLPPVRPTLASLNSKSDQGPPGRFIIVPTGQEKTVPPSDSSQEVAFKTSIIQSRLQGLAVDKEKDDQDSKTKQSIAPVPSMAPQIARVAALQFVPTFNQQDSPQISPILAVSGADPMQIQIRSGHSFSYRSFRLHDPERCVFDFAGLSELSSANVPDIAASSLVKSVRVGTGDLPEGSSRLVLDLVQSDVPVNESFDEDKKSLSILVGKTPVSLSSQSQAPAPVLTPMPDFGQLKAPPGASVLLDPGHGGSDPGAERGDIAEKEITLEIVEKLKKDLEAKGVKVRLTRSDDTFVSLQDRVSLTNNLNPNAFVSVHINSLETTSEIHGIETYYQTDQSKLLADMIHDCLVGGLSAPDRAVRKAHFYVVNHTAVPAVLAEVGFISNRQEREKLISSDYQEQVARSLATGVILYLDKYRETAELSGKKAATASLPKGKELN